MPVRQSNGGYRGILERFSRFERGSDNGALIRAKKIDHDWLARRSCPLQHACRNLLCGRFRNKHDHPGVVIRGKLIEALQHRDAADVAMQIMAPGSERVADAAP